MIFLPGIRLILPINIADTAGHERVNRIEITTSTDLSLELHLYPHHHRTEAGQAVWSLRGPFATAVQRVVACMSSQDGPDAAEIIALYGAKYVF